MAISQERIRYATSQRAYQQEKRKESKVRELDLELWRQRHEQLMQEAERGRLVRELRAARRRALSRPGGRASGPAGRFVGHILAVLRVPREKARC